jgi:hypothetical protein
VGRALGRAPPVSAWWPSTDAVLAQCGNTCRVGRECEGVAIRPRSHVGRALEAGGVAMRGMGATRVMARGRDHRGLIRDRGRGVPG